MFGKADKSSSIMMAAAGNSVYLKEFRINYAKKVEKLNSGVINTGRD